jgi:hypothetical protein
MAVCELARKKPGRRADQRVPKPKVNLTRYHSAGESERTSYA